jgi:radical SAM superfamily enzyme YgiQ (UPF0313 family)
MRVLLISANTERINMVTIPLGLGLVAAAVRRAGHQVAFLDLLHEADAADAIRRAVCGFSPDAIGVSVRNIDDQSRGAPRFLLAQASPVVAACRAASAAPIVLGGAGFSIFPAAALAFLGADYGVSGDGEVAFPALLDRLESGGDPAAIPGVLVAGRTDPRPPLHDEALDPLPVWDDALSGVADPADESLWVPVQSRRGCPNDCSYCSTAGVQGRAIRTRDSALVVAHVARLAAAGYRRVYFVDNSFNIPYPYALALCAGLRGLSPRPAWRCILYPHLVDGPLVEAMAAAGCVEVSLGFESGSAAVLRALNKRFTPDDVRAAAGLLAEHGIRRMGFLLLGGPGETRETVEESLAFVESLRLESYKVTVGIRIYPGTPLARLAVEEEVVAADDDLLLPRFYLAPGLDGWLQRRVAALAC